MLVFEGAGVDEINLAAEAISILQVVGYIGHKVSG